MKVENDNTIPEYLYLMKVDCTYRDFFINDHIMFLEQENPFPINRHSNIYKKEIINTVDSIYFTDRDFCEYLIKNRKLTYVNFDKVIWSEELTNKFC